MNVLILGATSSVAGEVAQLHAARGDRLHLVARNEAKLKALAAVLNTTMARPLTAREWAARGHC